MATKTTITFKIPEGKYDDYEECYEEFANSLQSIGIMNIDVIEDDGDSDYIHVNKDALCEIDGELFFNEISMDTKEWSFDYDELEEKQKCLIMLKNIIPMNYKH